MSEQRIKPGVTPEQLAATFGVDPAGVTCSGGQYENFREGWATAGHEKVHYYRRSRADISLVRSLCGVTRTVRMLFAPGNWPKCARCLAKQPKPKGVA